MFVLLQSHLLLCWHGFYDVSVTLCNDVRTRNDSTELAVTDPNDISTCSIISMGALVF